MRQSTYIDPLMKFLVKFCVARIYLVKHHQENSQGSPGGWIKIKIYQNTIGRFNDKIRMITL